MKKLCFVSIIFFLSITPVFSDIQKDDILNFPIILNNEYKEITALDIEIDLDKSIFEILDVKLDGGILKNQFFDYCYDLVYNEVNERIYISIIATPETKEIIENQNISFVGPVAFISFLVKKTPDKKTLITIENFICDQQEDAGGFELNGHIVKNISFDVPCCNIGDKKTGIEDAIYTIECLSGIRISELNCNISLKSLISILQRLSGIKHPSNDVVLKKDEITTIPIVLEKQQAIGGLDIKLTFDDSLISVKSIEIKNGILDGKNYEEFSRIAKNKAYLFVYTEKSENDYVIDKGPVVYVSFKVRGNNCFDTKVILTKFACNAKAAQGGFKISDSTYKILNLKKLKERTISGRVIAADSGKGLANSLLEVWETKSSFKGMSLTDVDGYYILRNLPPSREIIVGVWPFYGDYYIKQYYNNKKSRSSATFLSTLSNNLENIDFILDKKL